MSIRWNDDGSWTMTPLPEPLMCIICDESIDTSEPHWQRASTDVEPAAWHTSCGDASYRP